MNEVTAKIAKNIAHYRNLRGFTQKELGEAIGTTGNTISNWEKMVSRVDIESLLRMCSVLRISLDEAYGIKKEPAPETDSLEWLRQGLLETGVIKNSDELSERQLEATFGVMEIFVKNLKKVNEK